jgi:hypothetical protein
MIGGATVGHFSINQFLIAKMPYDAEKSHLACSLLNSKTEYGSRTTAMPPAAAVAEGAALRGDRAADFLGLGKTLGQLAPGRQDVMPGERRFLAFAHVLIRKTDSHFSGTCAAPDHAPSTQDRMSLANASLLFSNIIMWPLPIIP